MGLCWWCCHEIPGEVFHLPYKFEKEHFYTCGQFCSWACVKAYNIYSNKPQIGLVSELITLYRKRIYNTITPLQSAPPRYSLKAFGGKLTIEQFRGGEFTAAVKLPNDGHWVQLPNEKYIPHITEVEHGDLVLKRTKPLKRDQSGIQKLISKKS